jgi:hypothetical protein
MDDLKSDFDRILGSTLTQEQIESERAARYRMDSISRVASNTATADQIQSFEKKLRSDMDFQRETREQLKTYGEQRSKNDEEAERLYLALGRVLVREKRLPPHGPPLYERRFSGCWKQT